MTNFIDYLNSLHRCSGANENATAEANLQSEFYADLLVENTELIDSIVSDLEAHGKVLLTGFAGDGKTVLAERVIEKKTGKKMDLSKTRYTGVDLQGQRISVIKDFSETSVIEDSLLIGDLLDTNVSTLLVSNTGTVIRKLKEQYGKFGFSDPASFEETILAGLDSDEGAYKGQIFIPSVNLKINVYNLLRYDNLDTAEKILRKIIDHPSWNSASDEERRRHRAYQNISLLKADNYHFVTMMFKIYRRIYAYGERLTMRNLIEHFAFIIMGDGHERYCHENFFGAGNPIAEEMPAIKKINAVLFGNEILSSWKRKIWIDKELVSNHMNPLIRDAFEDEIRLSKESRDDYKRRLSVIRLVFFYYVADQANANEMEEYRPFVCSFLNSPGFSIYEEIWENNRLRRDLQSNILTVLKHVLKEYFFGMKLPESPTGKNELLITMSRGNRKIRQTAQVIVGRFEWRQGGSAKLEINQISGQPLQLSLVLKVSGKDCRLPIPLPFLDYLLKCHEGLFDDTSFSFYRKRLELFKTELIQVYAGEFDEECKLSVVYLDLKGNLCEMDFENDGDFIFVNEEL